MKFVANLRQETIEAFGAQDMQPAAFLLSSHRVSTASLRAAKFVRHLNLPLFADNGTKPLIDQIIRSFADPARLLREDVRKIRRRVGHVPRGADVPDALRATASALANAVVARATAVSKAIDREALLSLQLSMNPTDLIAQEDFATACLIALDLERETTGWPVARLATRNRRSIGLWAQVARDPRCAGVRVYAVLSAMDYNTARSAGRLAGVAGVRFVALGIAGITLDRSATDFMVRGHSSFSLGRAAPRRYVRLTEIACGLVDGFADSGTSMSGFHCLGLGAAALLPIPAAALSGATAITSDATSPIHDAVRDRVLYSPTLDGRRENTVAIVQQIVEGQDWPFVSPFTRAFRTAFGHDAGKARGAWAALDRPAISNGLLARPGPLTDALPLFSNSDPELRSIAPRTWIAHNHWVLGEICNALPAGSGRRAAAQRALRRLLAHARSASTARGLAAALDVLAVGAAAQH